jgi:hypothetical protein
VAKLKKGHHPKGEFTAEALWETWLTCIATQDGFEEVRDNLEHYITMNRLLGLAEQESWQKDAFVCVKESFDYISRCGITCP